MKRRFLMSLLVLVMVLAGFGTLAACKKSEGPETGIFYYDGEGDEYLITLNSGDQFSFMVRDANKSGTYSLKGQTLTLNFNLKGDGKMDATMSEDRNVIVLNYESAEMRFVRRASYTVNFESNGGSEVASMTVVNGKSMKRPADPTRDDYVFVGWFLDAEFKTPFVFGSTVITGDTTLYARWGEKLAGQSEFNVSFNLGYENAPEYEDQRTIGGHLYTRPQPTREGFEFRGWWVSMYDDSSKLSYAITDETLLQEDVVAYARWEQSSAGKLASPEVWMTDTGVYWNLVSGASSYDIEISGPDGFAKMTGSTPTNSFEVEWPGLPMGDYVVYVTATSGNSANASAPAICNYKNRALARVSRFEVVLSSTLIFNPVKGADHYTISVDCGDKSHSHTDLDNGSSTYFNFSNCLMQEGGIKFVVTAHGQNYMDSVSKEFVYERTLQKVDGIRFDEETQTLHWNEVPNAANYILEITCPIENHHHETNVGNKTSVDLKECGAGSIMVSVTPKTKGYNSPEKTDFSFTKTRIATPTNFKLKETTISWDPVSGAKEYVLVCDGVTRTTRSTEFDLKEMTNWATTSDYTLTVATVDASDVASPASDGIDMRYMALYSTVNYYRNTFSWRYVLGATRYSLTLNEKEITIPDGKNYAEIAKGDLRKGENTFKLKFYDNANNIEGSEEVVYTIQAYQIIFDPRSGICTTTDIVVAYGDKVELPTATRDGYELDGWYNAPGGAESNAGRYLDEYYQELGDIVLYASWAPVRYTITYVYDDGRADDGTEVTSVLYQRKFVFKLPTSIVATNGFLGWYSEAGEGGEPYTDQFGVGKEPWSQMQGGKVYAHWAHVFDYELLNDPSKIGGKIASVRSGPEVDQLSVLTVPTEYDGYPVRQVAGMGFMGHENITEINLPDTLILIGTGAFDNCTSLEKVNIYETGSLLEEEIQYRSFNGVVCRRVGDSEWSLNYYPQARSGIYRIPDGVTQIGSGVFASRPVTEIIIPADVTLVSENAFQECDQLTKITFESALDSLKKELVIENNAFNGCGSLTEIVFPRQLYQPGGTPDGYNGMVKDCPNLTELHVAEGNIHGYSSMDNMILKDMSIVYVIPKSKTGHYQIPDYVIGVGPYAFAGMDIETLSVPKTLRNIGEGAFLNNHKMTSIKFLGDTISGGLQLVLGKYAFRYCDKLTEVNFEEGSTVGTLGSYCFDNCTALKEITLPSNLSEIQNNAFNNCTSLEVVNFEEGTVGRDFLTLGRAIFNRCNALLEINLPAHVVEIVYGAFDGADNLRAVHVKSGGSFSDIEGVLYGNNQTELIYYPKITEKGGIVTLPSTVQRIGDSVFKNFKHMTQITIPASVNYIGAEAFYGCTGLKSVIFEQSSERLTFGQIEDEDREITGSFAFAGCTALEGLDLPERVTEIPDYFMYHEAVSPVKISSIVLPNSITDIGDYAFYGASRLATVNFPTSLRYIGDYAFMGTQIGELNLEFTQLIEIGDSAFEGVRVTSLKLNQNGSLRRIGIRAFYNMKANTVKFADGLQTIESEAFSGAPVITIEFPSTLNFLGDNAFANCVSLQRYSIKSDITYGKTVFLGCSSLFEVSIEEGVTLIPENMLEGTVVTKISLPSTIIKIGQYAFANSTLQTVDFARRIQIDEIGVGAFQNCANLTSISLPEGIRTIGDYAFADCTGLTSFTVCASVTKVGDYAFSNCSNLASITFSGTDESGSLILGSFVFMNCGKLETIHFPANLRTLNGTIFSGCNMLKNVTFSGAAKDMFHDGLLISLDGRELILGLPGAENEEVTVPNTVQYVTNEAFARSRFKKVIFEEGGSNPLFIGSEGNEWSDACNVFANNDFIEEVHFPENLNTIGACAFENCTSLKKVNIPTQVQYIGEGAFRGATHVEDFDFSATNIEAIGTQAFYHCGTEGNGLSPTALPEGLKEIETNVFSYSGFTELTIPATVNTINKQAFISCEKLRKVEFAPNSRIRTIDEEAFSDCSALEEFKLAEQSGVLNLISDKAFYRCASLKEFFLPESSRLRTIGTSAFANSGLQSFIVRQTIMAIEPYAFQSCTDLKTVTFEDGKYQLEMGDFIRTDISRFEAGTFRFCSSLEEVKLPERMTNIGTRIFAYCTNLKKVELPSTMTYLPEGMFADCPNIDTMTFAEGIKLERIGTDVFTNGGPLEFTIPKSVTTIEMYAFRWASHIQEIILEEGSQLEKLQEEMFAGCSGLKHVNFGTYYYEELPRGIFLNCSSLEEYTIPSHLGSIPESAFEGCSGLNKIIFDPNTNLQSIGESAFERAGSENFDIRIPASVMEIADDAFRGCGATKIEFATRAEVPEPHLTIGRFAFGECKNLKSFVIPEYSEISNSAFQGSTGLEEITLPDSLADIPQYMLTGCTNLKKIQFKGGKSDNGKLEISDNIIFNKGKTKLYVYACGKDNTEYTIPDSVTTIIRGAFSYVSHLKKLKIPESVQVIEFDAFDHSLLEEVEYNASGNSGIEGGCFAYCEKLTKVTLGSKVQVIPGNMFYQCPVLDSVTWDSGTQITSIGMNAFADSGIKKISEIPSSCTLLDSGAFQNTTNLEEVKFGDNSSSSAVVFGSSVFEGSGIKEVEMPKNVNIRGNDTRGAYMFKNCHNLTKATLPTGAQFDWLPGQMFCFDENLKEVVGLENTKVERIDVSAFQGCSSLTEIKFPETLTEIGQQAFLASGLKSLTIGPNVYMIEPKVFEECTNLESVTFEDPEDSTNGLLFGTDVFAGCNGLKTLKLPNRPIDLYSGNLFGEQGGIPFLKTVEIPEAMTIIPSNLFANCIGLEEVKFASETALKRINSNAFANTTALKTIKIPNSVVMIELSAFENSGLESIELPAIRTSAAIGKRVFANCKKLKTVTFSEGFNSNQIQEELFDGCSALEKIEFPDVVTSVQKRAFRDCTSLKEVKGNKVTTIYPEAFSGCSSLETLTLPTGRTFGSPSEWKTAENSAFYGCVSLKNVQLNQQHDDRVIKLPAYVFNGCESLETIDTTSTFSEAGNYAFNGCKNLQSFNFETLESVGQYAFYGCEKIQEINLSSNALALIGSYAFAECKGATKVTVGKGVQSIGEHAFENCSSLAEVELNSGLTSIGKYAFSGCTSINKLTIPTTVKQIDDGAFKGVPKFDAAGGGTYVIDDGVLYNQDRTELIAYFAETNTFTVPGTVEVIAESAFAGTGITSISIASSVEEIGAYAFEDCKELNSVTFNEGYLRTLGQYMFRGCEKLTALTLPNSINDFGSYVFSGSAIKSMTIPTSANKISEYAFEGSALESIIIPASVTIIEMGAFMNSKSLTMANVSAASVTSLGDYMFAGCESLNFDQVTLPMAVKAYSQHMFEGCKAFKEITIPDGITAIGSYAFKDCSNLTKITLPDSFLYLGDVNTRGDDGTSDYIFAGTHLSELNVPRNVPEWCFSSSTHMFDGLLSETFTLTLPDGVAKLGKYMFANIPGESFTLSLPDHVQSLDEYAFSGTKIKSFTLPKKLTTLGKNAFENTALEKFEVESAGEENKEVLSAEYLFAGLTSTQFELKLPDYIMAEDLGDYMFTGLTATEFTLTVPDHIEYLPLYAFANSLELTKITINGKIKSTNYWNVYSEDDPYHTPEGGYSGSILEGCVKLTDVTFPETLENLGSKTFVGCISLENFEIPKNVKKIGANCFDHCTALKELTLPSRIEFVGSHAFDGWLASQKIKVEGSTTQWSEYWRMGAEGVPVEFPHS